MRAPGARSSCGRSPRQTIPSERRARCATCSTPARWSLEMDQPSRGPSGRDGRLRAALEPLGEDERPPALMAAVALSSLLALAVIVGALTIHGLNHRGGSLPA